MNYTIAYLAAALAMLVAAVGFDYARRQFNQKRREYRMSMALRRGLTHADQPLRTAARVLPTQS